MKKFENIDISASTALDGVDESIKALYKMLEENEDADLITAVVPMLQLIAVNTAYIADELRDIRNSQRVRGDKLH